MAPLPSSVATHARPVSKLDPLLGPLYPDGPMHNPDALPPVVAMLVILREPLSPHTLHGQPTRAESVRLLLIDGSEYELPRILVPQGQPSLTVAAAHRSLARDMRASAQVARRWQPIPARRPIGAPVAD